METSTSEPSRCDGDGSCLTQNESYSGIPNSNCPHRCAALPCPNVLLCNTYMPQWLLWAHGSRCPNCNISYGKDLEIRLGAKDGSDGECPICLDLMGPTVTVVLGPSCVHKRCIACFLEQWYWNGHVDDDPKPPFPYPDRWQEYLDSEDCATFEGDPIFEIWSKCDRKWFKRCHRRAHAETRLACPICRDKHIPEWKREKSHK